MNKLFILLFIGILFASCQQNSTGSCGEVQCTNLFAMITVQLQDSVGNSFIPDKVETYTEAGALLHQSASPAIQGTSLYTIIDDSHFLNIPKLMFTKVNFKIYKDSSLVKTEPFIVSADCCHVFKQAGTDTIIVK